MSPESLSQKILEKLQADKITPKAKWNFIFKNYFIWGLFGIAIILGSFAMAVIIFLLKNDIGFLLPHLSLGEKMLLIIPYFWIILLGGFVVVAYFNLKHTPTGYKIHPYLIVGISVLASLILGSGLFAFGLGEKIEQTFYETMPLYRTLFGQKAKHWSDLEQGLLFGVVLNKKIDQFEIKDFQGKNWTVFYLQTESLRPRQRVGVKGVVLNETEIRAEQVFRGLHLMRRGLPPLFERNFESLRIR